MKRPIYKSPHYTPKLVARRYAAKREDGYRIFEVDKNGKTILEREINREDLPPRVADECDKWAAQVYNQVRME